MVSRLALEKCEVVWMDSGNVYKLGKDFSSFVLLRLGEALGKSASYSGTCLKRGYVASAMEDAGQAVPVGHLVLVVHGVGESSTGSPVSKHTNE